MRQIIIPFDELIEAFAPARGCVIALCIGWMALSPWIGFPFVDPC